MESSEEEEKQPELKAIDGVVVEVPTQGKTDEVQYQIEALKSKDPENSKSNDKRKRLQAQRACSNCKRLHAKCDNERPCKRCIGAGLVDTCVDLPRKRRMSKPYTEAVNKVWESHVNTQIGVSPWLGRSSPIIRDSIKELEVNPSLHITSGVIRTTPYEPSTNHQAEKSRQNGSEKIGSQIFDKQDPVMEAFLLHQLNELRDTSHPQKRDTPQKAQHPSLWHSFSPHQDMGISVWKSINGLSLLVECNLKFIQLTGYTIEQLKDNFPCEKLFKNFHQHYSTKKMQITTAQGFKEVFVTSIPLFADIASERYFLINILEAPPKTTQQSSALSNHLSFIPELVQAAEDIRRNEILAKATL